MTDPDFGKMDGLLPVVTQHARTGRILTLAFQDEEAWRRTLDTGRVHFWSRTREELWQKGETSGNVQDVCGVVLDCDVDSALLLVDPTGPACHTDAPSCFFEGVQGRTAPVLEELGAIVADRDEERPEGSHTAALLGDPARAGEKVREEAGELVDAAADESRDRVAAEAADLLYHVLVLLRTRDVTLEDALGELEDRLP